MAKKCLHAYLEGIVQGVGMRNYVKKQADDLGIVGFVRNLPDGRVELAGEGTEEKLKDLYSRIENSRTGRVDKIDAEWLEAEGKYDSFEIRF
ncbi:acylphosphatase [Natranaerofaba carboxydovora]|uniref:acylphosphatase n=1 Tax=Natranaerofaba carboxydovora TaxID=2742683 RepID=UPI001F13F61B|nr:acylphosphatase [Natranaerofaba carboxydovora]UMZ74486.1 Acylphosphatase [Natranaerofaba carboxydovora]